MTICYLASPYSRGSLDMRLARYEAVTTVAAKLIQEGRVVFSPITMTHPLDRILSEGEHTLGSDYWVKFDVAFMEACSSFSILTLPGWKESSGIAREMEFFQKRDIEPEFIQPEAYDVSADNPLFAAAWRESN